jgi:1-acyl-sn-glycerol-3-phosphate acyltransferase
MCTETVRVVVRSNRPIAGVIFDDVKPTRLELKSLSALLAMNRVFARGYHRVAVADACPLPAAGPAILICNHTAGLDPFLLQSTTPRLITWMMAREYFDIPGLSFVFRKLGYIPVSRNGRDSSALKAALRTLAAGRVLGIFPEGRIAPTRSLLPFQPGVSMLARRSGAEVFPAYLDGTQRRQGVFGSFLMPHDAKLWFGPRVLFSSDEATDGEVIKHAVESLRIRATE